MKGICKLCYREKELIDAHIIPKAFFDFLYPENGNRDSLLLVGQNVRPRRSPIGPYDKMILCADCDHAIGNYDAYGKTIFLDEDFHPHPDVKLAELTDWLPQYDYQKLKLFCLSMLWRASISTREEFDRVKLGNQHEQRLHEMLVQHDPGKFNEYAIWVTRWDPGELLEVANKSILLPAPERTDIGENLYGWPMPRAIKIYFWVDSRPLPDVFGKITIAPGRPLYIVRRGEFNRSPEFRAMLNSLR